ncbi:TcpQ domain-containing protein [Pusillimonas sp.]|uniref:TcpQ domain-containing protein n=1 Tax=Pusillimonas sp. TaxID=3040095 RepID=UPI0037CC3514
MTTQTAVKACIVGLWATLAVGCASLPDWSLFGPLQTNSVASAEASYDFSWRLSGDRQAGPIQVFDDGRNTWLQFAPSQTIPAIFARTEQGDRLLTHRVQGPYVVLDGVWPLLILRAGALQSQARQVAANDEISLSDYEPLETASDGPTAALVAKSGEFPVNDAERPAAHLAPAPNVAAIAPLSSVSSPAGEAVAFSLSMTPEAKPMLRYRVSPEDGNLRLALSRWARSAGWTFEAEHWAVDIDIPIAGTAVFELEFEEAVQQLLASTELSERPLQPCFYANKVLRVVSYAQSCDRSAPLERA